MQKIGITFSDRSDKDLTSLINEKAMEKGLIPQAFEPDTTHYNGQGYHIGNGLRYSADKSVRAHITVINTYAAEINKKNNFEIVSLLEGAKK